MKSSELFFAIPQFHTLIHVSLTFKTSPLLEKSLRRLRNNIYLLPISKNICPRRAEKNLALRPIECSNPRPMSGSHYNIDTFPLLRAS